MDRIKKDKGMKKKTEKAEVENLYAIYRGDFRCELFESLESLKVELAVYRSAYDEPITVRKYTGRKGEIIDL